MFPADSLVASPRAEKARLYSALEQRLEQSLATLEGVVSARVHVSYELEAGESGRKVAPIHLSALVIYERDKNSFSGIDYEHISVVLSKRASVQHAAPFMEPRVSGFPWLYGVFVLGILAAVAYWVVLYRKPKKIEHAPPN